MLRTLVSKSPLFRRFTWSKCAYYLQTSSYRQISETANIEFNPGRNENDVFSQPKQNIDEERLVVNTQVNERDVPTSRVMDRNPEDMYRRYFLKPDQPENPRLLRVAIIGAPNAGKSTLINTLMGWKVNSVSKKVHTTRKNTNTVFTIDNAQIIFIDTPGVITRSERKKHHCDGNMLSDPERSLEEADAVGVIVDVSNKWTRSQLHIELLKVLYLHKDVPSFLILNKIDCLRNKGIHKQQKILLEVSRRLSEGIVGGKEFGRTTIEKKKDNKIKKPEDVFDKLEQKYGKLKVKGKTVSEDKKCIEKTETDVNEDFTARMKMEISDIIRKQSGMNNNSKLIDLKSGTPDGVAEDFSEQYSEKINTREKINDIVGDADEVFCESETVNLADATETKLSKDDSEGQLLGTLKQEIVTVTNNSNLENDFNDILDGESELTDVNVIYDSEIEKPQIVNDNYKTDTENETTEISEQFLCDSDKDLTLDISAINLAGTADPDDGSSVDEIIKKDIEESYQSEFLSHIQSLPPLPEFSGQSANDSDCENHAELPEEILQIKEAIAAVKDKHGWPGFDMVFPVSSLDGSGVDNIKDYLLEISHPADWVYHSSVITDQHPFDIAKMCVSQSFLDNMDSYLPYVIDPEIIFWDVDSHNRLNISMDITLANTYEMNLVLRKGGAERIRAISASARQALMDAFQCEIRFKLAIRQKKKRS